jgi:DNA-binding IclR family transcriptional regulator
MTSAEDPMHTDQGDATAPQRIVRSVKHAIALLRVLAASGSAVALSDLARKTGLSKTSTFHLLRTLEIEKFVARDEGGRYRLSWGAYEIGSAVTRSVDLTRTARPHLDRLAEATGEATLLGILEGESVLYIDRGQADQSFTMVANVGRRSPLHTNASGKLLLAYAQSAVIDGITSSELERRTFATITDPAILRRELDTIRTRGYATCWQEQETGLNSIATPVRDYTGTVCAALTVAGPSNRLTKRSVPRIVAIIQQEADQVSESLGWNGK